MFDFAWDGRSGREREVQFGFFYSLCVALVIFVIPRREVKKKSVAS